MQKAAYIKFQSLIFWNLLVYPQSTVIDLPQSCRLFVQVLQNKDILVEVLHNKDILVEVLQNKDILVEVLQNKDISI